MKPILFNTEMVKSILDGRKTATRRIIKPQPISKPDFCFASSLKKNIGKWHHGNSKYTPPCHAGDILYMRETWKNVNSEEYPSYFYKANDDCPECFDLEPWRPSIHMPKEAARIFLRVKEVRVERLQDITEDGVIAEGTKDYGKYIEKAIPSGNADVDISIQNWHIACFSQLWNSTIKDREIVKYGWLANPWVWVIEFERISREKAYATEI